MTLHSPTLDAAFHALGDGTRRAVISRLCGGEMPISALAALFDMALPSFMQHIGVLAAAGLVITEKRGRSRYCRLTCDPMAEMLEWITRERAAAQGQLDRLETYLDARFEKDSQ